MRIVLTHPFCWPYVRRGAERFLAELGRYLSSRGHDVVLLSTKPGKRTVEKDESGTRILYPQFWCPALSKLRLMPMDSFLLSSLWGLAHLDADAVHSLFHLDAWASSLVAKSRRRLRIYHLTGPPVPGNFRRIPPDRWFVKEALRQADIRLVNSEFNAELLLHYYGLDAKVLQVPVDLESFTLGAGPEDGRPTILSVGAFDDPRKGLKILVKAFQYLKERIPDAVLQLSGRISPQTVNQFIEPVPESVRRDIHLLGIGELEDVPRRYGRASVTALASMWEVYGMSSVESWACGTPIVVTNHGALAELGSNRSIAVTFDPGSTGLEASNVNGLVDALEEGLALSQQRGIRQRCREYAETFSWTRVGPEYERLYA